MKTNKYMRRENIRVKYEMKQGDKKKRKEGERGRENGSYGGR